MSLAQTKFFFVYKEEKNHYKLKKYCNEILQILFENIVDIVIVGTGRDLSLRENATTFPS